MLLIWQEYKEWEKDEEEFAKIEERHSLAQKRMDLIVNFEERFQQAYQLLSEQNNIQPIIEALGRPLEELAEDNFNYVWLYFERILSEYTLNEDLWTLFVGYTDEKCKKKEVKQDIYERAVKNCP